MLTNQDFEEVNFPFEIFNSDNQLLSKNHDQLENIDYFSFFNFNNLENSKVHLAEAQLASLNSKMIHDQGRFTRIRDFHIYFR